MKAFFDLYAWFMRTTGLKMSERMGVLARPPPAKAEEDIADSIEAWEREEAELIKMDPSLQLPGPWRMTALKCLLTPKVKDHVEMQSGKLRTYEELREDVMTYATQKRLNRNRQTHKDPNRMDTNNVNKDFSNKSGWVWMPGQSEQGIEGLGSESQASVDWGMWSEGTEVDGEANAVGKGKKGSN